MSIRKYAVIIFLFVIGILAACSTNNTNSKKSCYLSALIEGENISDISVEIYYKDPFLLTRFPWTVDNLIDSYDYKIIIDGTDFMEYFELIEQINDDVLIPTEKPTYQNVRLYYIVKSRKNGKIFDVAMWGGNGDSIFVDGIEIKENDIFYELIKPFLPEDIVDKLNEWRQMRSHLEN